MKKPLTKTQEGFSLGIVGQRRGSCCRGWCMDCDFIRKTSCPDCMGRGSKNMTFDPKKAVKCKTCKGTGKNNDSKT